VVFVGYCGVKFEARLLWVEIISDECVKPAAVHTFLLARGAGKTTPLDRPSSTPSSTVE
jgi:hypothetical protein